jgi:hypothetical protein
VDTLSVKFSIMVHVPDEGGGVSRHIVMDDAPMKTGPSRLSLPLSLSRDGYWCAWTRYAPRIPLCPDCREWLRNRARAANEARAAVSFYEVASESVDTEGETSG